MTDNGYLTDEAAERSNAMTEQPDKILDRLPPHDYAAEKSVLGECLLEQDVLPDVLELLTPSDFYRSSHRLLYETMLALSDRSEPIDVVTLRAELTTQGILEDVGGVEALLDMAQVVPTIANAPHYAKIVRDKGINRELIFTLARQLSASYEHQGELSDLLEQVERAVYEATSRDLKGEAQPMHEILIETLRIFESTKDGKKTGLVTGFYALDELTKGLQPSDLIILAGRPSMGKTSLALNIAEFDADEGGSPLIFSLEMSRQQLVQRMVCAKAGVSQNELRGRTLSKEQYASLEYACKEMKTQNIWIDDSPDLTPRTLRGKARRVASKTDITLIIIDYVQLMTAQGFKGDSREREVSAISRSLKALARELNVPVIAVAQLNREVEKRPDKTPRLADLRESGSLEQDADVVMFLYRSYVYSKKEEEKTDAKLIIAKHRSGPTGEVELMFDAQFTRFRNPQMPRSIHQPDWHDPDKDND